MLYSLPHISIVMYPLICQVDNHPVYFIAFLTRYHFSFFFICLTSIYTSLAFHLLFIVITWCPKIFMTQDNSTPIILYKMPWLLISHYLLQFLIVYSVKVWRFVLCFRCKFFACFLLLSDTTFDTQISGYSVTRLKFDTSDPNACLL